MLLIFAQPNFYRPKMKKFYTLIFFITSFVSLAQVASCSLDPVFIASNKKGIWPDSATNFSSGTVNQAYLQNITVKVPKDTITGFGTFCFNRVELSNPTGFTNFNLPPGLTLLGGPSATVTGSGSSIIFKYAGNASGCALITGTPTAAGIYTVQFKVQPYVTPAAGACSASPNVTGGGAFTAPSVLAYYTISITPPIGVKEEINSKTLNISNTPNPFSGKTLIKFSVKDESPAKLCVYNLLGEKIYEDKFKTVFGENTYELNAAEWNSGIYLYTIQYKNFAVTKRMVLNSTR